MQVLTKVETSLKFNQILLRSEAKNFTEVAKLACRGEKPFSNNFSNLSNYLPEVQLLFLVAGPLPGHERKCISHVSLKMLGNQTAHSFPGIHIAER